DTFPLSGSARYTLFCASVAMPFTPRSCPGPEPYTPHFVMKLPFESNFRIVGGCGAVARRGSAATERVPCRSVAIHTQYAFCGLVWIALMKFPFLSYLAMKPWGRPVEFSGTQIEPSRGSTASEYGCPSFGVR